MNCTSCSKKINPKALRCPFCKTLLVSEETFKKEMAKNRARSVEKKKKDYVKQGRNALFIIGGLNCIVVFLFLSKDDTISAALEGFIALLFFALGFIAIKKPFGAILTGIIIYGLLLLLNAVVDPLTIIKGLLIKIAIIYYLVKGLKAAKSYQLITNKPSDELLDDIDFK